MRMKKAMIIMSKRKRAKPITIEEEEEEVEEGMEEAATIIKMSLLERYKKTLM